nr:hypothetical protein [Tanacetum cinerariifolium]
METIIEQQVALDEALVPSTQRLRIGRSNFRLPSDIQSKESTLQLVYDVLRRCPFFMAFLVTVDVPEVYMQEFWATAYVHQRSIRFKMNNKKHIVELESFREMLHICPRIPGQAFAKLPFKEEILEFIRNQKKSNEMYYPRFTKVIIHHFMSKDLSILRRNKINWHYVRDDSIFSTIKVVSRHQNTQQYGAMLPIELTNDKIRNTKAYKEYYACATEEAAPKPKASARRKRSGSDTTITPPTATITLTTIVTVTSRLTTAAKGKQPAKAKSPSDPSEVARTEAQQLKIILRRSRQQTHVSHLGGSGIDEGTGSKPGVPDIDEQDDTKRGGDDDEESKSDEESDNDETREEESFDPLPRTPKDSEDDGNGEEDQGLRISEEERLNEKEKADELYRDVDINQGRGLQLSQDIEDSYVTLTPVNPNGHQESSSVSSQFVTSMINPISDEGMESIFATASSPVAPLQTSTPIMTPSTIATITTIRHTPIPSMIIPSEVLQNLPTFDSVFLFEDRLKSLEANFSEYIQTNLFAEAVSNIPGIVQQYMNQQMNEARIIKEQVKSQVKEQVSRILPRIEQSVNAQLEAEVLTRSSHSSRTSYAVAVDLSEMELKKILIKKMEGNKSIQCSDEQINLCKALVDAYKADMIILDSYGETVILKRRRDDDDDQEEGPSAGSDRGSKRRREGKEPESASAPLETATRSAYRSTTRSKSRQVSASESGFAEEPVQTTCQMDEPSYPVFETGADDQPIVQSSQHSEWFSQPKKPPTSDPDWNKTLPALRVDTQTPKLLAGPTFELMKGLCTSLIEPEYHLEELYKATMDQLDWVNPEGQQYPHNLLQPLSLIPDNRGRRVTPFAHFINNDLEYLQGGASSRKYTTSVTKTKAVDYGNIKWIEDVVPHSMWIQEPINYNKHAL